MNSCFNPYPAGPGQIHPSQSCFFLIDTIETRPLPPQVALMGPETRLDKGGRRGSSVGRTFASFFPTLTRALGPLLGRLRNFDILLPTPPDGA